MDECPTPAKVAYSSVGNAQRGAAKFARMRIADGEHFDPMYIYRCPCGMLHLTRKPSWDGVEHELVYEVAEHLQAFARERPTDDA